MKGTVLAESSEASSTPTDSDETQEVDVRPARLQHYRQQLPNDVVVMRSLQRRYADQRRPQDKESLLRAERVVDNRTAAIARLEFELGGSGA